MSIWIIFILMGVLAFINISANLKAETVIENYSSEIMKIVRRDKLDFEIPKQVPLSESQKETLISNAKKSLFYSKYAELLEYEYNLQKYMRRSTATGFIILGVVLILLFWTWLR